MGNIVTPAEKLEKGLMKIQQYLEAKKKLGEIEILLKDDKLTDTERKEFEVLQIELTAALIVPWFPADWVRRIIMIVYIIVSIVGILIGYRLFWLLLVSSVFFSPRLGGEAAMWLSRVLRKSK